MNLRSRRVPSAWRAVLLGLALALAVPVTAWAQQFAVTNNAVNMRAGPDRSFPLVAWLPAGVTVSVLGCVDGWRWCDVLVGGNRGWVYSGFLTYAFQGGPVPILQGGPMLGLPLITFSIGPYWDSFYRNRPWWNNRTYWYNRPLPPPPVWRPPPPRPPSWQPPSNRPPRPPSGGPPSGGRPPSGGPPSGGWPPSGRPPGGGGNRPPGGGNSDGWNRPPGTGNPGGGNRPPGAGNPGGGGRPPGTGNQGGGRPPPSRPPTPSNSQQ
jgi:uncharacterized protein YraI